MITTHFRAKPSEDEEDLSVLRQCMRPEEDLREYRRRVPWKGEYRYFRSENVACIEHFRRPPMPGSGYRTPAPAHAEAFRSGRARTCSDFQSATIFPLR